MSLTWSKNAKTGFHDKYQIWEPSREKLSLGFSTRSDTNQAVQPKKMATGYIFYAVKNKNLCFSTAKSRVSHDVAHMIY